MGIFAEKKTKERNEIDNKEVKEMLVNAAMSTLTQGEDYISLANSKVEFGYLFDIDGHGIEALFKIVTDKLILYFAAQKQSVVRLDFDEAHFCHTTETFLGMHS